jgi:hypothetical protein
MYRLVVKTDARPSSHRSKRARHGLDNDDGDDESVLSGSSWKDRFNELADYRKIHGNCNVPIRYSKNKKLGTWVTTQRSNYRLHREGKTSHMTTFRIKALERLGFEWDSLGAAWEGRLSELTDYRKINGHWNLKTTAKTASWLHGSQIKGDVTGCSKKERYRL